VRLQVVSKPNDSVIYKSYTRQLSTTMEARRTRLERMQTLPNIKLTSPTPSWRRMILNATTESPSEDHAPSQQQRSRPSKTTSFVKRMSEGRFFQTDRSPFRQTSSPVLRLSSSLLAPPQTSPTPTGSGGSDQLQSAEEQLPKSSEQDATRVDVQQRREAEHTAVTADDHDVVGAGVNSDQPATSDQTPPGDSDSDDDGLPQAAELLSVASAAATTPLSPTTDV